MRTEVEITPEVIKKLGLTPEEYERIKGVIKREPNITELGVFSVMYSEHCSYKNSRKVLGLFPKSGPRVLVKAGEENAGVVDIGDGLCVCFKIESHNHPSFATDWSTRSAEENFKDLKFLSTAPF